MESYCIIPSLSSAPPPFRDAAVRRAHARQQMFVSRSPPGFSAREETNTRPADCFQQRRGVNVNGGLDAKNRVGRGETPRRRTAEPASLGWVKPRRGAPKVGRNPSGASL
ncbi:unnamed protein product [Pleuronectes platessa]|uniref:Uncharacterized protein n=1 Tax=Pleuronectes platessa TaxID=8262 RepID=A0A9N7VD09_PLEPL|nr:unnamed protein product [Pleuronectes platessa]